MTQLALKMVILDFPTRAKNVARYEKLHNQILKKKTLFQVEKFLTVYSVNQQSH